MEEQSTDPSKNFQMYELFELKQSSNGTICWFILYLVNEVEFISWFRHLDSLLRLFSIAKT